MLPGAHRLLYRRGKRFYVYWYAWRGKGAPVIWRASAETREAVEALERAAATAIAEAYALAAHPRPQRGYVCALVADFRASEAWRTLAPQTRKLWSPHLDEIDETFGPLTLAAMQRKGVRKSIRDWHASYSPGQPRKANVALTVLVRLFNHGCDIEEMERNPAAGLPKLDEGEGRAAIVWTQEEVDRLVAVSAPALSRAIRLAWLTGLRREDLIRLTWADVDLAGGMIRRPTLKSKRQKRLAFIPIDATLAALLAEFPRQSAAGVASAFVVTSEKGGPYATPRSFSRTLERAQARMEKAHPETVHKHLHDMRGTRASHLFAAGATDAEAETFFGWAPGSGAKMRQIYGSPDIIAQALGRRLRAAG